MTDLTYYVEESMAPEYALIIPNAPVPYPPGATELTMFQVTHAAEAAAEDFFHNCDGWESQWPLTFVVLEGDEVLGRFSVEQRMEPYFIAHRELVA